MSCFYYEDKELQKLWDNATIADNFIFTKVMQNKQICKHTLEILLGIKI